MPAHDYDPMYGRCCKCQRWLPGYPGGYHGETIGPDEPRCECYGEHRGSRPHMDDSDPTFADAAFRPFTPEQEEMFKEKSERIWTIANGVRR